MRWLEENKLKIPDKYLKIVLDCVDQAMTLAGNHIADKDNLRALGTGRTAHEALAAALYCCIRYENDFQTAVCAAINQDGDSAAAGCIAGSILGAKLGYSNIPDKWKEKLECRNLILEVADELCHDFVEMSYGCWDAEWYAKYVNKQQERAGIGAWHHLLWENI